MRAAGVRSGCGWSSSRRTLPGGIPSLGELYDEETMKAEVDRLNRLYVALTRAKREMYVIGVKSQRDTYPFDLLPGGIFCAVSPEGPAAEPAVGTRERSASSPTRRGPCRCIRRRPRWAARSAAAESWPTGSWS